MKKFICVTLCVLMALATMTTLTACGEKTVRLGLGLYVATPTVSNATEDGNGKAQATVTVAAVTLDAAGKIVACQLDTADTTVEFTADGKAVAKESIKTKYEMGKDYNMVTYGNAAKEWFEQADAFEGVVVGKTVDEVKALVAAENKGTDEVINAGCTIMVSDFVKAIEKAVANAVETGAASDDELKLGVYTQQTTKDAAGEDVKGSNKLETTFFAAAMNDDGVISAVASDCVQIEFTFDNKGASSFDTAKAISSKREQGANYGMVAYGNAAKEWFEQADAFNAACVGKKVSEINALMGADNYGNADVKSAGCTILVNGFVKAAAKIG